MQMLLTRSQEVHQITTLQVAGSLNAHNVSQFFDEVHHAVTHSPHSTLLVDMKHVDTIDSAGLMAIVSAFRLAQTFNKRFLLCSVSRTVQIILELTQLDEVLEIIENPNRLSDTVLQS